MLKKPGPLFYLSRFQILKEIYLQILKKPSLIFCFRTFSNSKKSILRNMKKNLVKISAYHLFQILKMYTYNS